MATAPCGSTGGNAMGTRSGFGDAETAESTAMLAASVRNIGFLFARWIDAPVHCDSERNGAPGFPGPLEGAVTQRLSQFG